MQDYGARWAVSFTDAGIVSTNGSNSVRVARALFGHLAHCGADVIIAELGDGLLGNYGVAEILENRQLMNNAAVIVMCANDPVGAWGAQMIMQERFGLFIDVVSGPTTDNAVGTRYIEQNLGLAAFNAGTHGEQFGEFVLKMWRQKESRY
jgi:hypothetical protein